VSKALTTCRRCSLPIEAHELIIELDGGDVIHIRCWLVGETQERARASHDDSHRRLRDCADADPDDPDVASR
jgi:hypothetical protein